MIPITRSAVREQMMEALNRNSRDSQHPRLLVIEDDSDVRDVLHMVLDWQYEIIGLSRGDGILQVLDRYEPNLVIMDVNLPGKDGFELCRAIRSTPRHRHIPVLFLTVLEDNQSFVKFLEVYGDAYLNKPFEAQELRYTIERLLNSVQ